MNIHQATAYRIPVGEHKNTPIVLVALNHPEYLVRLAEEGAPECPKGSQFHQAATLVVERMRQNQEEDIINNRTIDPHLIDRERLAWAASHNAHVLGRASDADPGPDKKGQASRAKAGGPRAKAAAGIEGGGLFG